MSRHTFLSITHVTSGRPSNRRVSFRSTPRLSIPKQDLTTPPHTCHVTINAVAALMLRTIALKTRHRRFAPVDLLTRRQRTLMMLRTTILRTDIAVDKLLRSTAVTASRISHINSLSVVRIMTSINVACVRTKDTGMASAKATTFNVAATKVLVLSPSSQKIVLRVSTSALVMPAILPPSLS